MGLGDQLLATGMARGARARGKRIAFGDKRRIIWDKNSAAIFEGNPNVLRPGKERVADAEWIPFYKGHRIYNTQDKAANRWIWNFDFKPAPGEMFFTQEEVREGERFGKGFVLIEPHVERYKSCAPNKDWGFAKYQAVTDRLRADGFRVAQFHYDDRAQQLRGAEPLRTKSFRDALTVLSHAAVYVGPEGGLHHGAAAVDTPAVVIFGGFIPPQVTGYGHHSNFTGGATACGSLYPCQHCKEAMKAIGVDEVYTAARDSF